MTPVEVHRGDGPVVLGLPHTGTHVPPEIESRLNARGRGLVDTDWHVHTLYDGLLDGASTVRATFHRYVIDANRDPGGASLYPGQNVTGLCPVDTFDETPLYPRGDVPDDAEIAARREAIWQPYHAQLRTELDRIRTAHGVAVLWDAHSIRSVLPRFFEGTLPDLNLGTADGASCDPALAQELLRIAQSTPGYTAVLNGRFKGGHITRHYGDPARNIHAVQLEMTQCSYMQEALPFAYLPERAAQVQPHLRRLLEAVLAFADGAKA